jgi:uncharacterized protein YggE
MNSSKILLASTIVLAVALAATLGVLYSAQATQILNSASSPPITTTTTYVSSTPTQSANVGTTSTYPTQIVQLNDNTLSVSGYGLASVTPDRAKIYITISTEASTAQESAAKNAEIFSKLIAALQQAGIGKDKVETSQYNIYPVYYYPPQGGQSILTGYKTDQSLTVTVIPENGDELGTKTGQVIDLAVGAGVNQVSSIYFTVSDTAIKTLQNQALVTALKDADGQAKIIADTLGLKIVTIKSVSYGSYYPYPIRTAGKVDYAPASATEVVPGALQISANAQVVYAISQA